LDQYGIALVQIIYGSGAGKIREALINRTFVSIITHHVHHGDKAAEANQRTFTEAIQYGPYR
jgi:hypothetical protein